MLARRRRRSCRSDASANTAMISDAATITNPFSRGYPCAGPPSPITVYRSSRSFTSSVRGHVIVCGSTPSSLPWYTLASRAAASRLWAACTAWKSPLKCRLMSSMGTTWAYPPPLPPPLMPKTGPMLGSRRQSITRSPMAPSPCVNETLVVVLPSPALVGVIAVVMTSLPSGRPARRSRIDRSILARCFPYSSSSSGSMPAAAAMSAIGRSSASWAISSPDFMSRRSLLWTMCAFA